MSTRTSRRHRSVWSSRDRPSEGGRAEVKLGLREDGTMHRSVADRRLHGAPSKVRRSGRNEPGASILARVPISGGVPGPPNSENLRQKPHSVRPRGRIRLGIRRPRSASRAAQTVAEQHENAPVSASAASAVTLLSQHRAPTRSEWALQRWDDPVRLSSRHLPRESARLWVSPRPLVCDPDQVALPRWIDALNRLGPSGDDRAATPSASDIPPGSIRVGWLCAAQGFSPVPAFQTNHVIGTHRLAHRDGRCKHFFNKSR
jgi:hypothetical protein